MSRPDEGLIHAWLDGELDAAEAARVEALVRDDPAWAAAAAEARGLIAASARIVGALDDVPAGVLPKPAPGAGAGPGGRARDLPGSATRTGRRGTQWWTMRVAALLVVAVGTGIVFTRIQDGGGPEAFVGLDAAARTEPADSLAAGEGGVASATPSVGGPARVDVPQRNEAVAGRDAPPPGTSLAERANVPAPGVPSEADAARRTADQRKLVLADSMAAGKPAVGRISADEAKKDASQLAADTLLKAARPAVAQQFRAAAPPPAAGAAAGAGAGAGAASGATVGSGNRAVAAEAMVPGTVMRAGPLSVIAREECYRETPTAADAVPVIHRVGRTSDSTALPGVVFGFERQRANEPERREVAAERRDVAAQLVVRGDTLILGTVDGVRRIALLVTCPAP